MPTDRRPGDHVRARLSELVRGRGRHGIATSPDETARWWDHVVEAARVLPDGLRLEDATSLHDLGGDAHAVRFPLAVTWPRGERWVYKPRHSWMESFLATFVDSICPDRERAWAPGQVVTTADFSWSRAVVSAPARSRDEVECFFWRSGVLLAVAQYLRLGDINHENVLASGAQPVLVDAEVFLRPTLDRLLLPSDVAAAQAYERSPLSTAYLPLSDSLAEPSGLGVAGGSRDQLGDWRPSRHLPELDGRRQFPHCFVEHIVEGFTQTRAVLPPRADVVRQALHEGDHPLRVIVRGTAEYGAALRWYAQADAQQRCELVPRLHATLDAGGALALRGSTGPRPDQRVIDDIQPRRRRLCELEATAIRAGMVPLFHARADDRHLTLAGWAEDTSEVMTSTPLEQWHTHVGVLAERDLDEDAAVVRAAVSRHHCLSLEGVR